MKSRVFTPIYKGNYVRDCSSMQMLSGKPSSFEAKRLLPHTTCKSPTLGLFHTLALGSDFYETQKGRERKGGSFIETVLLCRLQDMAISGLERASTT